MKSNWWQGKKGEGYVVAQFILFGLIFMAPFLFQSWGSWPQPFGQVGEAVGLGLGMVGLILAFAGLFSLGRNLTAVPYPKEDANLVQTGAYKIVRHPIYSGVLLGALGWSLMSNSLAASILTVALFLLFDKKSHREEQWLRAKYPNYAVYQTRVRKLIPFIY